ncbi:MAG TPA: dihydroneopterin aldolase [Candidatus Thermoplasmatota archaeon]|nr:dihydroneopterin aldolase [Candidatus Thermoplasmatota archaeon]
MDRVTLRNMRVFTHVGCSAEERRVGQHLEMDLEFHLDLRDVRDRISASVDYALAHRLVKEAVEGVEANLIETVAERAAEAVKGLGAQRVVVRVRKSAPPIPGGHADHAEVQVER